MHKAIEAATELYYPRHLYPKLEYLGEASQFIDAIFEAVEQIPIFGDFVYGEIRSLTGYMECFGAPAGEEILTEGEAGDYLLLLLTGSVEILKVNQNGAGARRKIAVVGPGTTLGEMSLVDGEPRFASCVTIAPTDFALLHRNDLNRLIHDMPHLSSRFLIVLLQLMTRRLRETSIQLMQPPIDVT